MYVPMMVTTSQPWNRSQPLAMAPRKDRRASYRSRRTRKDSLICGTVSGPDIYAGHSPHHGSSLSSHKTYR